MPGNRLHCLSRRACFLVVFGGLSTTLQFALSKRPHKIFLSRSNLGQEVVEEEVEEVVVVVIMVVVMMVEESQLKLIIRSKSNTGFES